MKRRKEKEKSKGFSDGDYPVIFTTTPKVEMESEARKSGNGTQVSRFRTADEPDTNRRYVVANPSIEGLGLVAKPYSTCGLGEEPGFPDDNVDQFGAFASSMVNIISISLFHDALFC